MIDFTTLQIEPIPVSVITLQNANTILQKENKVFKNIMVCVLIGGAIYVGYQILKRIEENEQNNRS